MVLHVYVQVSKVLHVYVQVSKLPGKEVRHRAGPPALEGESPARVHWFSPQ